MQHSDDENSSTSQTAEARVLLSVSVSDDLIQKLIEFSTLTNLKRSVVYKEDSDSTLVLVTTPVLPLARIPNNETYRFIDFIRSASLGRLRDQVWEKDQTPGR